MRSGNPDYANLSGMIVFLYLIDKPGEVYDDGRQRYVKKENTNIAKG